MVVGDWAGIVVGGGAELTAIGCVAGETVIGALVPGADGRFSGPEDLACPLVAAVARAGVDLVAEDTTNPRPATRDPAAATVRMVVQRPPARRPLITAPAAILTTRSRPPPWEGVLLRFPEPSHVVSKHTETARKTQPGSVLGIRLVIRGVQPVPPRVVRAL